MWKTIVRTCAATEEFGHSLVHCQIRVELATGRMVATDGTGGDTMAFVISGISLDDMTAADAQIVNSWFRHDESTADELTITAISPKAVCPPMLMLVRRGRSS